MTATHQTFLELAVYLAAVNASNEKGSPFGAVVVRDGKVIGTGQHSVLSTNDITSHAEIEAIRNACSNLGSSSLSGCSIYSSCHPCPMCLGACLCAGLTDIYYASSPQDARNAGFFNDHNITIASFKFNHL